MADEIPTADRLTEIKERHAQATPGPWYWSGWLNSRSLHLMSPHKYRPVVLAFMRWGMGSAQPAFRDKARDLLKPVAEYVKTRTACSTEIVDINHPDAQALRHSWADVEWLIAEVERLRGELRAAEVLNGH